MAPLKVQRSKKIMKLSQSLLLVVSLVSPFYSYGFDPPGTKLHPFAYIHLCQDAAHTDFWRLDEWLDHRTMKKYLEDSANSSCEFGARRISKFHFANFGVVDECDEILRFGEATFECLSP